MPNKKNENGQSTPSLFYTKTVISQGHLISPYHIIMIIITDKVIKLNIMQKETTYFI